MGVDQLLAAFDAAHSSVRDAEQSTAVLSDLRTGLIVWMEHTSEGSTASRESVLLTAALMYLDPFDDGAGKDLPSCCIDQVTSPPRPLPPSPSLHTNRPLSSNSLYYL
jgi:hypothetical protein